MELGPKAWAQVAAAPRKSCATPEPAAPETAPPGLALPAVVHSTPRPAPMLTVASTAVDATKRQKNTPSRETQTAEHYGVKTAMSAMTKWQICMGRPSIEERLPQDTLEAVLGLLDRDTLCTARLVSKTFCAAASANVCSLTCSSTEQGVSLQRFPRLIHVAVRHSGDAKSLAQVAAGLRDVITVLKITQFDIFKKNPLVQIALMPKLRELELDVLEGCRADLPALLPLCTGLQVIKLPGPECSLFVATARAMSYAMSESWLWDERDDFDKWAGDPWDRPLKQSWVQQDMALRNLQALSICTTSKTLPLIANLTGLTGLTWFCHDLRGYPDSIDVQESPYSIDPLMRLTKLRSLCLPDEMAESNVKTACSLGMGSLVSLSLGALHQVSDDCGRFLTRQTALVHLTVGQKLCDLRHVATLRIEALQCLELADLSYVDAAGISALRQATTLTRLAISLSPREVWQVGPGGMGRPVPEDWLRTLRLSQGIGGLTQLRSLALHFYSRYFPRVPFLDHVRAVRPLTGLTQLEIEGGGLKDGDLRALLGLTGLRVLDLSDCCLTDAVVPELSVLTNLRKLQIFRSGAKCRAPVRAVLDPLRHARGWPPMDCIVE